MQITRVSLDEWRDRFANNSYTQSFGQNRDISLERIDFALIAVNENPVGFVTCIEMDAETIYWQFGGAFDEIKRSLMVLTYYVSFINYCKERYKRITTRVENTNISMIRMALACGFLIQGTWNNRNKIYLELCLEF